MRKRCSIVFLCCLLLAGCGNVVKEDTAQAETISDGSNVSEDTVLLSDNLLSSEKLTADQDEIVKFFVGDDYYLF